MNIVEKLKQFNVEVTPEMEKAFAGDFLSDKEVEKKLSKLQTENETLKERAETAEGTLKGFEGKDFDEITRERDEWKRKAEEAEKNHAEKMAEYEKQELLKEALANVEFTSESAKKTIVSMITEGVSVKNGRLIGFNDLLEEAKKSDASAFVDKEQQILEEKKAKFTTEIKQNGETLTRTEDLGKLSMAEYIAARKK